MSDVRQTKLRLLFSKNETDVTSDLSKDLLSWNVNFQRFSTPYPEVA